jgi:hypothetical protein
VQLIDTNPGNCRAAESEGLAVLYGSGLDDRILERARLGDRLAVVALTSNEDANYAFARKAHQQEGELQVLVALRPGRRSVTPEMVREMGGEVAFGEPRNLEKWSRDIERDRVLVELLQLEDGRREEAELPFGLPEVPLLPLAGVREGCLLLPVRGLAVRPGDRFYFGLPREGAEAGLRMLAESGWRPVALATLR